MATNNPNTNPTPPATTTATDKKNAYQSSDPTTDHSASASQKLAGDAKGAAAGVVGGIQAATGTVLRNDAMAEKGFEKMSHEDQRLAAKTGKPPVGADSRSTVETVAGSGGVGGGGGVGTVSNQAGLFGKGVAAGEERNTGDLKHTGLGS
jgi:hypothetical protein